MKWSKIFRAAAREVQDVSDTKQTYREAYLAISLALDAMADEAERQEKEEGEE
jgi:hypothetical protein